MSLTTCDFCGSYIDTDEDTECYTEIDGLGTMTECWFCREQDEDSDYLT